ncbi:NADH-quinone oxidoreductase subunit H [Virgisporangium ochraceum]|uniref:Formate hydrogenlyase n=1 Tax=Virgisporangium ochraceum TaxID=65505 RepID=A0A8J3ZVY1_9ACTN|nr:NADH-quinone oxidoreductase subunit H [Virgisporangium ochraceum]GIJ70636.1 formate hydrogenlyase [Virgisporangium ochraceum]
MALWLTIAQTAGYALVAPLFDGLLEWFKARLSGRRGSDPLQRYRDLIKLLRRRPSVPASASGVFQMAPSVVFTCFLLLGFALPTVFLPARPGIDLLFVVAVLGLAKFATGLAAFDAGAPFGPLSSGRQWFVHILAEPAFLIAIYVYAMSRLTTNLPAPARIGLTTESLVDDAAIPLVIGALAYVLLGEAGRLPFDNPDTNLELTMIERGTHLEYSGRLLALVTWADAMKLTFGISLVALLAWPWGIAVSAAPVPLLVATVVYLAKVCALLLGLAVWEVSRGKVRLRALYTRLMLAAGVLLFVVISLVVSRIPPGA